MSAKGKKIENQEMGHTQGPWIVNVWTTGRQTIEPFDPDFKTRHVIAEILPMHNEEHKANARLIAAAPELLKALKLAYNSLPVMATPQEFLKGFGNWGLTEEEAKIAKIYAAAIAKAEGA